MDISNAPGRSYLQKADFSQLKEHFLKSSQTYVFYTHKDLFWVKIVWTLLGDYFLVFLLGKISNTLLNLKVERKGLLYFGLSILTPIQSDILLSWI